MSESDTMFNERDQRCAAIQHMLSTDPSYDNRTIASTLKMQIRTVQRAQGDENKVSGHCYGLWCGFKRGPHHATPHLRCTVTYHPSRKLSKLDEPDIWDTAVEVGTNSWVTYFYGPLHTDEQRQDDQLELTYSNSVPIQHVALKAYRERWTIVKGCRRGSGRSALVARHDDDDDDILFCTSEY